MTKLTGKYKRKNLIEFIVKDDNLVIKIEDFEEILEPYNEMEFIGEYSSRALRFEFSEEGKSEKVVVLTTEDEVKEFEYLE